MRRIFMIAAAALFCTATASAQTKVTGIDQCGKPDPQQMIPVGDRPDHSLGVAQSKCTWTKPLEIGGDKFELATLRLTELNSLANSTILRCR